MHDTEDANVGTELAGDDLALCRIEVGTIIPTADAWMDRPDRMATTSD